MSLAGLLFLFWVGLALPWLAIKSDRHLSAGLAMPARWKIYLQTLALLLFLLLLALVAVRKEWTGLFPPPVFGVREILTAAAALAIMLGTLPFRWQRASPGRRQRLYALVPRTGPERLLFLALAAGAGVIEEIVYRGVLCILLTRLLGSIWPAVGISALVFAVAHMVQGWKSVFTIFFFALVFHAIVWITGALYTAMAVHFLYDAVAGIIYGILGRGLEPAEAAPAVAEPGAPAV